MPDEQTVVTPAETATQTPVIPIEGAVETPAEQPQQTEVTQTPVATVETPAHVVPPTNEAVDEFGVPYKNRYMEMRRKNEELVDRLPQIIEEKLSKVTQPQTPTYTYEQLEVYKQQNQNDPNIVAWTVGEQRKIQQAEQRKLIEEVVSSKEQVARVEMTRQKSLEYVQKEYPMAFKKDTNGNPIEWDEANPITQHIFGLMKNPELANNPQGLAAAADIAYGRYARTQAPVLQQKVEQAKADVKQAQKASLTEGAGRRVTVSTPPQQAALESLRKTGSIKDAELAVGAILRGRGMLE